MSNTDPPNTQGGSRCSQRVSSSCLLYHTHHITHIVNTIPPVVSRRAHFYCVFCVYLRIMMSNISSYLMTLCSELRVVMSTMMSAIKTMFGSSLPSLVCRRAHVLFIPKTQGGSRCSQRVSSSCLLYHTHHITHIVNTCWTSLCIPSTNNINKTWALLQGYDFLIKTMFGSSIPPVVSRRAHFYCVFCVYLRIMHKIEN
jgi:hypothetical protein